MNKSRLTPLALLLTLLAVATALLSGCNKTDDATTTGPNAVGPTPNSTVQPATPTGANGKEKAIPNAPGLPGGDPTKAAPK